MAFKIGDILVDRIVSGVAENSKGELLYNLTNIQDGTIEVTADSTDVVDGQGSVIKTFYKAKTGTVTLTNSTLSLPIVASMSGSDPTYATTAAPITMPRIITTAKTTGIELPGITDAGTDANIKVNAVTAAGTLGDAYEASEYTVTAGADGANSTMAITAHEGDTRFIIKYDRKAENGVRIQNRSDKFPKTVKLTLKVLVVDPCETDVVRAAYVVVPSFQPSAEITVDLATDATIDYTGTMQTSYCGNEKLLYEIYMNPDDEEDE